MGYTAALLPGSCLDEFQSKLRCFGIESKVNIRFKPTSEQILLTYLIYALHLFSAIAGLVSAAFVLTAFLTGWPSIIAIILNYVFRSQVAGSYLESHFIWQIRTFWFSLLWLGIMILFAITVIGLPLAYLLAIFVGLWILYRVIRGLLTLVGARPMPDVKVK